MNFYFSGKWIHVLRIFDNFYSPLFQTRLCRCASNLSELPRGSICVFSSRRAVSRSTWETFASTPRMMMEHFHSRFQVFLMWWILSNISISFSFQQMNRARSRLWVRCFGSCPALSSRESGRVSFTRTVWRIRSDGLFISSHGYALFSCSRLPTK